MSTAVKNYRCFVCRRRYWRPKDIGASTTHETCGTEYTICARCYANDRRPLPPCPVCLVNAAAS